MDLAIDLNVILLLLVAIVLNASCSEFTVNGRRTFRYVTNYDLAKAQFFESGGNGRVILAVQHEITTDFEEKGQPLLDSKAKSGILNQRDSNKTRQCAIKLANMNDYSVAQLCNEGLAYKHLTSEEVQKLKPATSYITEMFNDGSTVDFSDNGVWYNALIMEPHEIDLCNYKAKKTISSAEACVIGMEVLKQLELLCVAKMVHRDMKPGNLMLEKGAKEISMGTRVYIIDFGYSVFNGSVKGISGGCFIFSSIYFGGSDGPRPCNDVESLIYILKYLLTRKLSWYDDALNFNADELRSLRSDCYKKIFTGKLALVTELRTKRPININADLAGILIEILDLSQKQDFGKQHYQFYMAKFKECHDKLMSS